MNKKILTQLVTILDEELTLDEIVKIHNLYAEAEGEPEDLIYKMSEFNEVFEGMKPSDIIWSLEGSFDITDSYFYEDEYNGTISFSEKKSAPLEYTSAYAKWILQDSIKVGISSVDEFVSSVEDVDADNVDWNEINETVRRTIEKDVDKLFFDMQTKLDIESGDIHPLEAVRLEDLQNQLAALVTEVLKFEREV